RHRLHGARHDDPRHVERCPAGQDRLSALLLVGDHRDHPELPRGAVDPARPRVRAQAGGRRMSAAPRDDAPGAVVLLDAVDRRARAFQNGLSFGGSALLLVGAALIRRHGIAPNALIALAAGMAAIVAGLFPRQRWQVEYRGHRIRFENGPTTAE